MNNTIKLAVASALLAAASSASAAGGIVAGDWTLDIGGVVNAYYTNTKTDGARSVSNITTGLLPNYLAVSGKTRQNDLDVGFNISINPGASTKSSGIQTAQQENRQAYLTFGDASWGSIKLGKDLGIYASDAILSDMTLLGVGNGAGGLAGNTTTLGRIGGGYMYADWKAQAAYTSPNFNGLSFTAGVTQAFGIASNSVSLATRGGSEPAFEGKASYAFAADAVTGKVWVSGITQKLYVNAVTDVTARAWDMGANINAAGFGLTGYYGQGYGIGSVVQMSDATGERDSKDYYVQATYTLPGVGTKLGASYGVSEIDVSASNHSTTGTEQWVFGAYHPLTKHLNLVAEYNQSTPQHSNVDTNTVSLGAILFF